MNDNLDIVYIISQYDNKVVYILDNCTILTTQIGDTRVKYKIDIITKEGDTLCTLPQRFTIVGLNVTKRRFYCIPNVSREDDQYIKHNSTFYTNSESFETTIVIKCF